MDACAFPAEQWYLSAPGSSSFPANYSPCVSNGQFDQRCGACSCRQIESATNSSGAAVQFVWCVEGQSCSATVCGSGSGSVPVGAPATTAPATTAPATSAPATTAPVVTTAAPVVTTAAPAATTAAPSVATTDTPAGTVTAASLSASGSGWASTAADDSASQGSFNDWSDSSEGTSSVSAKSSESGSSSKTVIAAVLIGVGVLVLALLCLCIRSYCKKRSDRSPKQFGAASTTTAASRDQEYPAAFGIITGHQGSRPTPNSGRSRAGSRGTRSNTSHPAVLGSPQSIPMIAASQVSSNSNPNTMSQYSGDSRDTRSSGGSVFSASVTNNGAAVFSLHAIRQAPTSADSRGRRVRRVEERSTESSDVFALSPGPTSSRSGTEARETAGFKWSVYSDDSHASHHNRSTVGRGMSSMVSDYSDIDGRSTHYQDRDTAASATSFFSDDSEFDRDTDVSNHGYGHSRHF